MTTYSNAAIHKRAITTKTTTYTATLIDDIILCDATSSGFTVTLPAASGLTGKQLIVKKTDSSVNTVIVDGDSSETIDGDTTKTLFSQYDYITIVSDGSNWVVVDNGIKSRYQRRILSGDVTADDTDITDLKYTNLVIGRRYKVTLRPHVTLGTSTNGYFVALHDSSRVARVSFSTDSSVSGSYAVTGYASDYFVATTTELIMRFEEVSGNINLLGDGSLIETFVYLEDVTDKNVETTELD